MSESAILSRLSAVQPVRPPAMTRQGWIIISSSWLAVAAAAVVAPVAPQIASHFAATAGAEGLVQLGIGLPALFVALLAAPFGFLADRIGRRPVLLTALVVYAVFGMAPLVLDQLPLILVSRAGVGVAEAAILAAGTALIGDLFQGDAREKWFAIQGGTATLVAVVLISVSGALGETGWRTPFLIYAAPLVIFVLAAKFISEPSRSGVVMDGAKAGVRWQNLAKICLVTFFAAVAFYVVLIQLPFLLVDRGFAEPSRVALGVAAGAITAPLGAYLFRRLARCAVVTKLAISFALSAVGLTVIVVTPNYPTMLVGAAINGIGSGLALPTLMTWAMGGLRLEQRGRVAGFWNGTFFLGQFLSPLLFIGLAGQAGGRAPAMAVFAAALGGAALVTAGAARRLAPAASSVVQGRNEA